MKKINNAVWRLTAIYTLAILVICIGFSITIYLTTERSFRNRPFDNKPFAGRQEPRLDFEVDLEVEEFMKKRDEEILKSLLVKLGITDGLIILLGGLGSFFLAKKTLKPINDNLESQIEFVSNASHELKTPITVIAMENKVILKDKNITKEELKKQLESNIEEVNNLNKLINMLLELARNNEIKIEKIFIKEVLDRVIDKVRINADSKNISIENTVGDHTIVANKEYLKEVFLIVLDNAIKYSENGSKVNIHIKNNKICIKDQGKGIDKEDLPHIFERFYRADKSHTTKGHGLGLALAKHLCDNMKLNIEAVNNEEKGTTFIIG